MLFWLLIVVVFCGIGLLVSPGRKDEGVYALAEEGRLYEKVTVSGLFLYDETVVTAPAAGTFYGGFTEGDSVAVGEVCGELHRLNDLFAEPVEIMTSPISGILSYAIDGWEGILTPSALGQLDLPSLFDSYEPPESAAPSFVCSGDACFKVLDSKKDLHLLLDLGTRSVDSGTLRLRFDEEDITAKVISLRRYGSRCFALVEVAPLEKAYHCRYGEFEWILSERQGVVVDSAAVTTRFGEVGVYCSKKGKVSFSPINVVCSDGGFSLVEGVSAGDCLLCEKSGLPFLRK